MPSLLVLGGSGFVGRAVVTDALARGWSVTTFNRGSVPPAHPDVRSVHGDRLDRASLAPLASGEWDLVVDTWSGAPRAVADSAAALAGCASRYAYISSCSVYTAPPTPGASEHSPVVDGDPGAEAGDYAALKRGAELAVTAAFGDRALLARAGLILGPHEDVGRLTWWLARMARGGEVLCPGPRELPLQYIDARDLAGFVIDATDAGLGGAVNVISRRGHATMESLLTACCEVAGAPDARLTWVDPEVIESAAIAAWEELPVWIPPGHEYAAMHAFDTERAHESGLHCRPVPETVADTWRWLSGRGGEPPVRPGRPVPGLAPERERDVLAAWHGRSAGHKAGDGTE